MKDGHQRDSVTNMECMIPSDVLSSVPVIHEHKRNLRNRFELKRTLGEGTYGKVKLAIERTTGEPVAIKYIKKSKIQDRHDLNRIRREIKIMASLQHSHIVRVNEVFENKDRIILVMECANGGELYDYINNNKLSEKDARRIFRQIVSAISFCHKNGIVHRDLKLENILLDQNNDAKIADFGLSNYYNYTSLLETFCGSPLYASPEIVNGQKYHGPEVDCWSLGVVLYTLVYGTMPFDGTNFKKLKSQISAGDYFEPANPSEAAGLIRHLLTANPAKRANISDICSHWWVNLGFRDMPNGEPYLPPMVLQPVTCSQNLSSSSESDDGEPKNRSKPKTVKPILKSILKKPKIVERVDTKCNENVNNNSKLSQDAMCIKNENADPLDPQPEDNVFQENDTQSPIACDANELDSDKVSPPPKPVSSSQPATDATFIVDIVSSKKVFDSQRMPARGILKRKGKFSTGDSGCELNSPTVKESSSMKSFGMDLSEGDSALDSPTSAALFINSCNLQSDSNNQIQSGAFSFNVDNNNTTSTTVPNFDAKDGPSLTYSVVPRRKSILKNKTYSKDDSYKRLSACSTGSNSSADILDFSYDSSDETLQLMKYYREESNSLRTSSDCDVDLCYQTTESLPSFDDTMIDFNEARNVCKQALDILKDS